MVPGIGICQKTDSDSRIFVSLDNGLSYSSRFDRMICSRRIMYGNTTFSSYKTLNKVFYVGDDLLWLEGFRGRELALRVWI